jgi:hypothetical protein
MATKDSFNNRLRYDLSGYPPKFANPLDMWYDRVLYGKVDQQGNVVHPSREAIRNGMKVVQPVGAFAESASDVLLIDFVAHAFKNFQGAFVRADATGKTIRSGVVRQAIQKPAGGYVDVDVLYKRYSQSIYSTFSDIYLKTSVKTRIVQNFDDYLRLFLVFAREYAADQPVTKTFFIKHNMCTPLISGLMVQLTNNNHDDDSTRQLWLNDPNFALFANTANQYGFLINKNAPWRLTANIASPNMVKNWVMSVREKLIVSPGAEVLMTQLIPGCMEKEETFKEFINRPNNIIMRDIIFPETSRHFFESYYTKSCFSDINELKTNLVNGYNSFVEKNPRVRMVDAKKCQYGLKADKITQKIVTREPVDMSIIDKKYGMDHWLEVYFNIRSVEEKVFFRSPKFIRILKSAQRIAKTVDNSSAVMYINRALRGFPETNSIVMTKPRGEVNPREPDLSRSYYDSPQEAEKAHHQRRERERKEAYNASGD